MRRFLEHPHRTSNEQLLAWNAFFAGQRLRDLLSHNHFGSAFDPWSVMRDQSSLFRGRDRLDQILRHNFDTYLLDDLLIKADRTTMAVGLELRSPFLDTELIELAFRLPSSLKVRFGRLKWILREAYRDVLPSSILDRKKHGFGVPIAKWWSGPLSIWIDDLLRSRKARLSEYLEVNAIRDLLDEHRHNVRDHGQRIFLLVGLELWLRGLDREGELDADLHPEVQLRR
jgi:asparagine synthase (glutamine-hydrolysing)